MKNLLKDIDFMKIFIYAITFSFLGYLFFIFFLVEPDEILFGNVYIDTRNIDFGGFGSLLAGIFSPLAFFWLILNFRQQEKNLKIAETQLGLLIEEINNKRKVNKAIITISSYSISAFNQKDNTLSGQFSFNSNTKLYKCNIFIPGEESPIVLKRNSYTSVSRLKLCKDDIEANSETEIDLNIDLNKISYESVNTLYLNIEYLDINGFNHSHKIVIYLSLKNTLPSSREKSAFIVMIR